MDNKFFHIIEKFIEIIEKTSLSGGALALVEQGVFMLDV